MAHRGIEWEKAGDLVCVLHADHVSGVKPASWIMMPGECGMKYEVFGGVLDPGPQSCDDTTAGVTSRVLVYLVPYATCDRWGNILCFLRAK